MELKLENLYDDAFYVEQSNWKTWKSYDKDRNALVTSLTQETCIAATRYYLKLKQDGSLNDIAVSYSSIVDGKL
jgi:hypothetical protein